MTWGLGIRLHLVWLGVLVTLGFGLEWLFLDPLSERRLTGVMVVDTVLHTAVFALSGGSFNPFTALYLVNIVLATLVLSRSRQWLVFGVSLVAFGSLFVIGQMAPSAWALPSHQDVMRLHLNGMWWAFLVAAGFIVAFVQRILRSLEQRAAELGAAKRIAAQHEKLSALTTLAAGAAHELATPLGSIAVASAEMGRALERLEVPRSVRDDVQLIREQVARCRAILDGLSEKSGELSGEATSTFSLPVWLEDALEGVAGRERVEVRVPSFEVRGPRRAMVHALRNLIKNALEASTGEVRVVAHGDPSSVTVSVHDVGPGLAPELLLRLGEPFFSTKPSGQGMGLGVFLAKTLAEQLGGSLSFDSVEGRGTTATLTVPQRELA
jgi:two-component system sensor histidine kinase RegB